MDVHRQIDLTLRSVSVDCEENHLRVDARGKMSGRGPKKPETVNEISKMLQHVRSF